jgi:phosphohistidine swiveling domain-containing protein
MTVRWLNDIRPTDAASAGSKATSLAGLVLDGIAVPGGFVVTANSFEADGRLSAGIREAILSASDELGAQAFAVRSSAEAEDLAGASFAGQYLTLLHVPRDAVTDAAEQVHRSGDDPRLASYQTGSGAVAVLIQAMLAPSAAGVAFTADPVSGERDVVLVHAVRGLGNRLVDGTTGAEEWRVQKGVAVRTRTGESAIDAAQANQIAELASAIEARRGGAQDIEWAIADGQLYALQARPMTALPEATAWDAPTGAFARNFRLGEWIGDPVTPLFESWLLTTMERTMHDDYERIIGQPAPTPLHVIVNGWYFYSLNFLPASAGAIVRMLPGILRRLPRHGRRLAPVFPPLAHLGIDLYVDEWRDELLPRYKGATNDAAAAVSAAPVERVIAMIDELSVLAGHYFTSITFVAGYGWKTELPLAQFYRKHLVSRIGGHAQQLLRGLSVPTVGAHAVMSLDWSFPTHGETSAGPPDIGAPARHARLVAEREELERRAKSVLSAAEARRFDRVLAESQRAAALREEQVADLTLPWPFFRLALRRIGEVLASRAILATSDDVYFLRRSELVLAIRGGAPNYIDEIKGRRALWARRRRLVAPIVLGTLPRMLESLLGVADRALRDPADATPDALRGTPASPGRVTGRARVVRGAADFDRFQSGEVLVCAVTTPAWTSLFARAAAVVTDVGSPAAHASIIAREYGIPAVVGTGDGTTRITDGTMVTVDGGAGLVLTGGG